VRHWIAAERWSAIVPAESSVWVDGVVRACQARTCIPVPIIAGPASRCQVRGDVHNSAVRIWTRAACAASATITQKVEIMSSPSRETLDQIKVLLRRDLKLGPDIEIPDDMPFAGTEADFDSLDILLLLTSIEKQFHIKIPSEVVGKEVFKNVSTLASYVEREAASGNSQPDYLAHLPHRDPFRFISKVKSIKNGEEGEAAWTLSGNEPFFAGHFPNQPLVPLGCSTRSKVAVTESAPSGTVRWSEYGSTSSRFHATALPPAVVFSPACSLIGPIGPCVPGIHFGYCRVSGPGFAGMTTLA